MGGLFPGAATTAAMIQHDRSIQHKTHKST